MMYLRGQPAHFDRWHDEADCSGWRFADVLSFFKRAEGSERGEGLWHGGAGPIRITRGRSEASIADALLHAMADAGLPLLDDLNADVAEGFGFYDAAILNGRRVTASAYLRDVADVDALQVLTGARVVGLTARATGSTAYAIIGAAERWRKASGEVILAAGCINTTRLLLLSSRMGRDDDAVVDLSLRVNGVRGLRRRRHRNRAAAGQRRYDPACAFDRRAGSRVHDPRLRVNAGLYLVSTGL